MIKTVLVMATFAIGAQVVKSQEILPGNSYQLSVQEFQSGLLPEMHFCREVFPGSEPESVFQAVSRIRGAKVPAQEIFQLENVQRRPFATIYTYVPYRQGAPAWIHRIQVLVDDGGNIRKVSGILKGLESWNTGTIPDFTQVKQSLGSRLGSSREVWMYLPEGWEMVLEANVKAETFYASEFQFFRANGQMVHRVSSARLFAGMDTSVKAKVFLPDPLTSAEVPYGGAYQDFNDQDTPALNNERFLVDVKARLEDGKFVLKDTTFYFEDLESPQREQPLPVVPEFFYTRSQEEFEFVNIYYHLTAFRDRVQQYGYTDLPGTKIQVDAHGSNGQDVSGFSLNYNPPALIFGDGGIDDGEDADVIVHEFGHALSHGAAPGTASTGLERRSMEEANCDYFAMSYSRSINPYNYQKTFNWDGNVTWQGRRTFTPRLYPGGLNTSIYDNGEIWVDALAEIFDSLGREVTDKLIIGSLYSQENNMTFVQMARIVLLEDTLQNGGMNTNAIYQAFARKTILGLNGVEESRGMLSFRVINSAGFVRGEKVTIDFAETGDGEFFLYQADGRLVRQFRLENQSALSFSGEELKKGLYVLYGQYKGLPVQIKLIR